MARTRTVAGGIKRKEGSERLCMGQMDRPARLC